MKKIKLPNAPEPKGHYSSAVVHNGLIFVSGQLPINHETGEEITDSIEAQTEQCLRNVEAVLLMAGSDLNHVLKFTIFVSAENLWGAVNETYARILGEHKPARAIIPVGKFRGNFLIEIEAIAEVKE
ncbi:MAG: RidA family protein [Acidobacteria bacterium]|nr:RidA family protein [Acidobacteriota bacterium]MBA3785852.1 RidA family protein [Acidobacteriota bacterium]MBA4182526.1 RidA family protein [Acidobacteriota bacterium]HEV8160548.1 RidA family protein [Pyrinomonadaceae bacterium]